jgi:hypothetical protein
VLCYVVLSVFAFVAPAVVAISDTTSPSSSIQHSALHRDDRAAADLRPQVRDQVDEHAAGRHALVMGLFCQLRRRRDSLMTPVGHSPERPTA